MGFMIQKKLPVKFFSQKGGDLCAPASLQMVLEYIGGPSTISDPSVQNTLYFSINTWLNPPMFGDKGGPLGVACTLNRYAAQGTGTNQAYRIMTTEMPYAACDAMVKSIFVHERPSLALVQHGIHWVVVIGAQTNVDPTHSDDYALRALWINDPDSDAGSEHITYGAWLYLQFTGSPAFIPQPFVCVVDDRANSRRDRPLLPPPENLPLDLARPIFEGAAKIDAARTGLAHYDLDDRIRESTAGTIEEVRGANHDGEKGFFVVHFVSPKTKTETLVRIDMFDGTYLGAQFDVPFKEPFTESDVFARAESALVDFAGRDALGAIDRGVKPVLVWSPNSESASPYKAFYWLKTTTGKDVYVRTDGIVFFGLTFV